MAGCNDGPRGVEGLHGAFKALVAAAVLDRGVSQNVVGGDAAVLEDDGGRVAGADAELLFDLGDDHARCARARPRRS